MHVIDEIDFFKIKNKIIVVNYLSGAIDNIDLRLYKYLHGDKSIDIETNELELLKKRRYIFSNKYDYEEYINKINESLLEKLNQSSPEFLIIPSYNCNLNCSYCFEHEYDINIINNNSIWIDKAFNFIENVISLNPRWRKETEITLMGGEPLLKDNIENINKIIHKIKNLEIRYRIITNGVDIDKFIKLLKDYPPASIQITLDGPKFIHDNRRKEKSGKGTYEKIINNIKLINGLPSIKYIRINIDKDNIDYISMLSEDFNKRFENNSNIILYTYPMQDGGCFYEQKIMDENSVINKLNRIKNENNIKNIKSVYHGSDFLDDILNNKKMKYKINNCSAFNNQYILDCYGDVYKCWFGIGNRKFSIGNYINEKVFNSKEDLYWKNRNIISLKECKNCKYRYICGGGCISHIYNQKNDIIKNKCVDYYSLIKSQIEWRLLYGIK